MGYFSRLRRDQNDDIGRLHPQAASFIVRSHFKNACSCSSDGTLTDHCHSEPSTSRLSTILRIVDSLNDPRVIDPEGVVDRRFSDGVNAEGISQRDRFATFGRIHDNETP